MNTTTDPNPAVRPPEDQPVTRPVRVVPPAFRQERVSLVPKETGIFIAFSVLILAVVLFVINFKKLPWLSASSDEKKTEEKTEAGKTADKPEAKKTDVKTDVPSAAPTKEAEKPPEPKQRPAAVTETASTKASLPPKPVFQLMEISPKERQLVSQMFNLNNPSAVRTKAALELGDYPWRRVANALTTVVQEDLVPQVRAAAATSMGEVACGSFLPVLENSAANDPDASVRKAAKEAAKRISDRVKAGEDFE